MMQGILFAAILFICALSSKKISICICRNLNVKSATLLNAISSSELSPAFGLILKQRVLVFRLSILLFLSVIAYIISLFLGWDPFHVLLKALGALGKKVLSSFFKGGSWAIGLVISLIINWEVQTFSPEGNTTNGFETSSPAERQQDAGEISPLHMNSGEGSGNSDRGASTSRRDALDLNHYPNPYLRELELLGDLEQIDRLVDTLAAEQPSSQAELQAWERRRRDVENWFDRTERGLAEVKAQKADLTERNQRASASVDTEMQHLLVLEERSRHFQELRSRFARAQYENDKLKSRHH